MLPSPFLVLMHDSHFGALLANIYGAVFSTLIIPRAWKDINWSAFRRQAASRKVFVEGYRGNQRIGDLIDGTAAGFQWRCKHSDGMGGTAGKSIGGFACTGLRSSSVM